MSINNEKYLFPKRYQELMHNNVSNNNILDNIDIIKKAIENGDNDLLKTFNNMVSNDHEIRVNLIKKILSSEYTIENNVEEITKFFGMLSPLNIEYAMGSITWDFKKHEGHLMVQNNALKSNLSMWFYENYLLRIGKILKMSNIVYKYKEFDNRRFFKSKDIIYIIKI
jgi:hypothetical protein